MKIVLLNGSPEVEQLVLKGLGRIMEDLDCLRKGKTLVEGVWKFAEADEDMVSLLTDALTDRDYCPCSECGKWEKGLSIDDGYGERWCDKCKPLYACSQCGGAAGKSELRDCYNNRVCDAKCLKGAEEGLEKEEHKEGCTWDK